MGEVFITRRGGAGGSGALSFFSYTGSNIVNDEGDGNWNIELRSSGTLTLKTNKEIDIFLVGGGGCGGQNGGAGGGYTTTIAGHSASAGIYTIVVGAGATGTASTGVGANGGTTSAFGYEAAGGVGGKKYNGGAGGSGGGAGSESHTVAGNGGSDGANGGSASDSDSVTRAGGTGQGPSTRAFGDADGKLFSGGGGGRGANATLGWGGSGGGAKSGDNATPNTGGGGGSASLDHTFGDTFYSEGNGQYHCGGSGIVIIRNKR